MKILSLLLGSAFLAAVAFAQTPTASPKSASLPADSPKVGTSSAATSPAPAAAGQPSEAEMMKMMMEMGKVNENHKLLGEMAGNWEYTMKMWMDPSGKAQESKGTAVRKPFLDGHYYTFDVTGKFDMPGPDGKMQSMDFKGMAIEGYDNAKKKFVSAWVDSMSTMIMNTEGTYDAATKTFTHHADCEMMPGVRVKMREVIKVVDKDHHTFEMYEDRGQGETKTMEIAYTRKK